MDSFIYLLLSVYLPSYQEVGRCAVKRDVNTIPGGWDAIENWADLEHKTYFLSMLPEHITEDCPVLVNVELIQWIES
jgi:hypothetical protein